MEIRLLADHPEFILTVAGWLFEQFGYLNPGASRERAEIRIRERLNTTGYPVTFISLEEGTAIGTASLVKNDLEVAVVGWPVRSAREPASRARVAACERDCQSRTAQWKRETPFVYARLSSIFREARMG